MALIYTNENFPLPVAQHLRELNHDVITAFESGSAGKAVPDEAVLAFAVSTGRILLTLNRRHFIRLHHLNAGHAGIIDCTFDPNFLELAQRIHQSLLLQPDMRGHLVRINRPG